MRGALPARRIVAVAVAGSRVFERKIEGAAGSIGREHLHGSAAEGIHGVERTGGVRVARIESNWAQQPQAVVEFGLRDAEAGIAEAAAGDRYAVLPGQKPWAMPGL